MSHEHWVCTLLSVMRAGAVSQMDDLMHTDVDTYRLCGWHLHEKRPLKGVKLLSWTPVGVVC